MSVPSSLPAVFVPDLRQALQIPEKGLASRILQDDEMLKVILYAFAAGHEMKLHSAPLPTMLCFMEGTAVLTLGEETMPVGMGAFTHMPANLKHAIEAITPTVVLLVIVKPAQHRTGDST